MNKVTLLFSSALILVGITFGVFGYLMAKSKENNSLSSFVKTTQMGDFAFFHQEFKERFFTQTKKLSPYDPALVYTSQGSFSRYE